MADDFGLKMKLSDIATGAALCIAGLILAGITATIIFELLDQDRCHQLIELQRGYQQAQFAVMLPAAGKQAEHCENNQALSLGHGQHQNVNDAKTIGP